MLSRNLLKTKKYKKNYFLKLIKLHNVIFANIILEKE